MKTTADIYKTKELKWRVARCLFVFLLMATLAVIALVVLAITP